MEVEDLSSLIELLLYFKVANAEFIEIGQTTLSTSFSYN